MKNEISIYVHLPFCKNKCLYCDFLSFACYEKYIEEYKQALIKEIKSFKTDSIVKSVFIGGGTPSILNKEDMCEVVSTIYNSFEVDSNAEITIEANPATFDIEKLLSYREAGINRISIGLQAWQNDILKTLGRIHTKEQFVESYKNVRRAGFDNINIDLMFSLPNQSNEAWEETLKEVMALEPEHISAYSLIIEEGTPFFEKWQRGELLEVDENLDREMYYRAVDLFENNGYAQYEISNFAKEGRACKHNIVYWTRGDYKGFGLGAASLVKGVRYTNTRDMQKYIQCEYEGEKEVLTTEDEMSEFMFLGLRLTSGISKNKFFECFGKNIYDIFGYAIEKHLKDGLLIEQGDILKLSKKGIDLSNSVFVDFI